MWRSFSLQQPMDSDTFTLELSPLHGLDFINLYNTNLALENLFHYKQDEKKNSINGDLVQPSTDQKNKDLVEFCKSGHNFRILEISNFFTNLPQITFVSPKRWRIFQEKLRLSKFTILGEKTKFQNS